MANIFRNTWRIHDPDTDRVMNDTNTLSIEFLPDGFVFSVMDENAFRYVALEAYQAEGSPGVEDYCLALRAAHADNALLGHPFRKVQAAVHTPSVVLVPDSVCKPGNMEELFATYASKADHQLLRNDPLQVINAQGVYALSQPFLQSLETLFPHCSVKSASLALIKNVLATRRLERWPVDVLLHVRNAFTEILLFEQDQFIFYRSFPTTCIDDLLYYVFYVLEQYQLRAGDLKACVIGELAMDSPGYAVLASFFKDLQIPDRNDMFQYGEAFDDIPCHYYYNLFNLNACES